MLPQPFEAELLSENVEAAIEFLKIFEHKSYNVLENWREMDEEMVRHYATQKLNEVHRDLDLVNEARINNAIH